MSPANDSSLPGPDVRGIDLGDAVLMYGKDKIVFQPKSAREHYTLHYGLQSGELDIHRTTRWGDGDACVHKRLFSIAHENLRKAAEELAPHILTRFMQCVQPLDIADLSKKQIGVVVGLLMTTDEAASVADICDGKLRLDPQTLARRAWIPERLEDLQQLEDGEFFTLIGGKRRAPLVVGHGFAMTDAQGIHRLMRLSSRRLGVLMDSVSERLMDAAAKYGTRYDD